MINWVEMGKVATILDVWNIETIKGLRFIIRVELFQYVVALNNKERYSLYCNKLQ